MDGTKAMRKIVEFKPFIPSNDYKESKDFYEYIGFKINWESAEVCEVDTQFGSKFLLLPNNHGDASENLMLHFLVNSAQEWYEHFDSLKISDKFKGTKVSKPELMPWGLIVTYVWDPAGVLLHFAEQCKE